MPSDMDGGLLDGGLQSSAMASPAKRNLRWLYRLLWPPASHQGGADAGSNGDGTGNPAPRPLRPTAYLDGLRGFVAFLVYIHHHELWVHASSTAGDNAIFENYYGHRGIYRFAALPFVRNFFTGGHIAVAIFYVISGYVLSAKPLSLIQSGEHLRLLDSLASSVFRRWFRLYIPIIVTTFTFVTLLHVTGTWTFGIERRSTLREDWWEWYVEFKNYSFLFKEGFMWLSCNTHLWSIPLEMRGSIIVFCAALSLSRVTTRARLVCMLLLIWYFMYIVDGYYGSMFMMGMLQCDLDMLAKRNDPGFPGFLRRLEPYKKTIFYVLFVIGMLLAGCPSQTNKVEDLRSNPGWYYLSFLKPQAVFDPKWFFLFFAASIIVACVPRMPTLKRFFESRFCQYLGRISYSLYLVHGPILMTVGDRIYTMVGWVRPIEEHMKALAPYLNVFPLPKVGPMGLELSFLLPHIILLPFTFWVADVVTRFVDEQAVRVSNNMYKRLLPSGEPKPEDAMRLA